VTSAAVRQRTLATGGALAVLGLAIGGALWMTGPAESEETWAPAFLSGYAVAWVCYVLAGIAVTRSHALPRWVTVLVIVLAVGMRVVALERTPPLSTDAYRYLWDGRVANEGTDPFTYPPDAAELRGLRDDNWRQIGFKQVPTIYPPGAQVLFRVLAYLRGSDIEAFRWTFAVFDVGTVLVLIALLRRTGGPPERVIWYAWCPLAITETTAGAHVDAVALFLLMLALLLVLRGTRVAAVVGGIALAGAVMTKGVAILAMPFLLRRGGPSARSGPRWGPSGPRGAGSGSAPEGAEPPRAQSRGGWRLALGFALACAALTAPYLGAGPQLFAGLRAYLGTWKANASIFLLLDGALGRVTDDHFRVTRWITSGVVVLIVATLTWKQKSGVKQLLRSVFISLGALLCLGAPTLPWYVIWVAPALCWWYVPGLALLTLTVSVQYYARWLYPGDRAAHYALLWAGYLPVYTLLIGQLIWRRVIERDRASATSAVGTQSKG
jgi:hypothetical protein